MNTDKICSICQFEESHSQGCSKYVERLEFEPNKVSDWEASFKQEFGIHFSESELQFAIAFISTLLSQKEQKIVEEIKENKHWIFTPPYGLETDSLGNVIPRDRKDTEYIKVEDIKLANK